jgi:hypothetical protein
VIVLISRPLELLVAMSEHVWHIYKIQVFSLTLHYLNCFLFLPIGGATVDITFYNLEY